MDGAQGEFDDPMRTFGITIGIDVPAGRVWQVMIDTDRWHEWTPSVNSIKRLDTGPLVVGSRLVIRQPKFPPARWSITAFDAGLSFTWMSSGPGIRVVAQHCVKPTGNGSQASLSLDFQGVFGSVFGRMTKSITERYLDFEARGLKARSENPNFRHRET